MKADKETLSCAPVDSLLTKIKNLASRPIMEFNKYKVLDLLEALKNTARDIENEKEGYFWLAYETLRGKLDQPNQMFPNFLQPLLGDKDHEEIFGIVAKVEKTMSVNSYQYQSLMQGDQVPNIVMFVVIIAESLGISV